MKALAICIAFVTYVRADTIELKTGERIEGTLKQTNATTATIDQSGRITTIPIGQVRAIYFGSPPSASASPASAGEPWAQALDAVKGLRSIVRSGVAYRDYAPRVLDAKVIVDRYVESNVGPTKVSLPIKLAMEGYVLVSRNWNTKITQSQRFGTGENAKLGAEIRGSFAVSACGPARKRISDVVSGSNYPADNPLTLELIGDEFARHPEILWECAATKVAEAEVATEAAR